jgi:hypothetical protein
MSAASKERRAAHLPDIPSKKENTCPCKKKKLQEERMPVDMPVKALF